MLCISPLTSIIIDQKDKFTMKRIDAEFVGEMQDNPESMKRVLKGSVQLVYISPESIINIATCSCPGSTDSMF